MLERQGRGKGQQKLSDCGGKAWTHKELKALEDGLVCLGAGRVADLREQVPSRGESLGFCRASQPANTCGLRATRCKSAGTRYKLPKSFLPLA